MTYDLVALCAKHSAYSEDVRGTHERDGVPLFQVEPHSLIKYLIAPAYYGVMARGEYAPKRSNAFQIPVQVAFDIFSCVNTPVVNSFQEINDFFIGEIFVG